MLINRQVRIALNIEERGAQLLIDRNYGFDLVALIEDVPSRSPHAGAFGMQNLPIDVQVNVVLQQKRGVDVFKRTSYVALLLQKR